MVWDLSSMCTKMMNIAVNSEGYNINKCQNNRNLLRLGKITLRSFGKEARVWGVGRLDG